MGIKYFMDWQEITVLLIVAGTAGAFLWHRLRRRKPGISRVGHCGCAVPEGMGKGPSIVFRARKGERPEVVVKFR